MNIEYAIIVRNKTRLEALIERFNTKAQAEFFIGREGGDFRDYEEEHERFYDALSSVQTRLSKVLKNKVVQRSFLPNYLFSSNQLVIVIGQDGLVANTAKYSNARPIIAVNPDPSRYDGVLLPFNSSDFLGGVESTLSGNAQLRTVPFAEARLNDGQRLLAFNDLFIGAASHTSARYRISFRDMSENHSSSGVIVSTQAGSTGWLSSVINMAGGVSMALGYAGPSDLPTIQDNQLFFAVREPFKSIRTQVEIAAGIIMRNGSLTVESLMPVNGVIFSDGIEKDFLQFNSGAVATIGIAPEQAFLVQKQ